jgi:GT2 family glycosyltransferase
VASRAIEPGGRGSALVALAWIESFDALDDAFDQVFGPAITALERSYAACPVSVRRIDFGTQPIRPSVSLIIPLHKRIDYLEVQLGLFCGQPCLDGAEILFVVDDPPRQQEAKTLAASAFARFGLAFALLLPDRNLGFGRASNAGLDAAAGQSVCFLNSDVFPASPDWMARLIARLSQGDYGIVAPMLLFPDGSMQHRGMALQAMDRYAGWHFPRHTGKGMRPEGTGIMRVPAVTGACIVMTRRAARELGGFDEGFVIGDFEDSDLCLRAARAGLSCGVDLDVRMLHLERQSQGADAPWRMGATLYNAWRHERRWFPAGEAKALDVAAPARGRGRRG